MVIDLAAFRSTGKIVECVPIHYDDALAVARQVEQALYNLTEALTEGTKLPARFADEAGKPCDSGDAA